MTVTKTELEIIEALDFDHEIVCDSALECDRKAIWHVTLRCCGLTHVLCQECLDNLRHWLQDMAMFETKVRCYNCGTDGMEPNMNIVNVTKL